MWLGAEQHLSITQSIANDPNYTNQANNTIYILFYKIDFNDKGIELVYT